MSPKHMDEMEEHCVPVRQSSTRSCEYPATSTSPNRAQLVRRSLKELRLDVGRNLDALVHRPRLERISESEGPAEKRPSIFERLQRTIDELPNLPVMPTGEGSVVERIDNTLNDHYYTIAYCVVIIAYMIGFAEYLYLRLISLIIPEKMIHHKTCVERANETVGKDGFHYGISIAAFLVIALFQLICFFGLTISGKWTQQSHFGPASAASLRREQLASKIRRVISKTMYRTFLCYGLCSGIICMIIFYMIGIQDSVDETASTICMYIFDTLVLLYFIAFPLTTVIYHPQVHCFRSRTPPTTAQFDANVTKGIAPLVSRSVTRIPSAELASSPPYFIRIPSLWNDDSEPHTLAGSSSTLGIPPIILHDDGADLHRTPVENPPLEYRHYPSEPRVQTVRDRDPPLMNRNARSEPKSLANFQRGIRTTTTV